MNTLKLLGPDKSFVAGFVLGMLARKFWNERSNAELHVINTPDSEAS
jgi:hypothetical protein